MVDDVVQLVASKVQAQHDNVGDVEGVHGITVVRQLLVLQVGQWLTLGPNTWQGQVEDGLHDKEGGEKSPRLERWHTMVQEQVQKHFTKVFPAFALSWPSGLASIKFSTDPHIDHQKRETCHHSKSTNGTTKVPLNVLGSEVTMRNNL